MSEVKGTYILMIVQLLSEYNPEIVDEASKELSKDLENIRPDDWLGRNDLLAFLNKLSPAAQTAIGKKVYPTIISISDVFGGIDNPSDMLKTLPKEWVENNRGDNLGEYSIIDSGPDFMTIKIVDGYPPAFEEGIMRGIFEIFKIIRINISTETDGNTVKYNIKWE